MIPKLIFIRFLRGLEFKTCRVFVLVIGLAVLFLCYGSVAHAGAVYSWTKTMGGTDHDYGQAVVVDSSGNVYVTGYFRGTADFNPDIAVTDNHTSAGEEDIFLTKINSDGSYGWTKTMGGADQDYGQSVVVDGSDNVYITGYFRGTADFNPDIAVTDNHTSAGEEDIFLTKINSDGSYGWTKTMG
ncbi:MAG: SBBP repeat-containing protein, partial [Desulfobacteraceae bacterium]|nr:SBBP repeat-containing protein [Desulfobacteraceae bacterium]